MPYYRRAYRYGYFGLLWIVGRVVGALFIIALLAIIAAYSALVGNEPPPGATRATPAAGSTSGGQ